MFFLKLFSIFFPTRTLVSVRRSTRSSSSESFTTPTCYTAGMHSKSDEGGGESASPFERQERKDRERGRSHSRSEKRKREKKEKDKKDKKDKPKKEKERKETSASRARKEKKDGKEEKKRAESSDDKEEIPDTTVPPPEPEQPPRKPAGPAKKGSWGNNPRQSCPDCGQKIARNPSALDQHQKFSEYCLSWQMYSKMSKQSQKEPDAWNRARMAARKIKLAGEKAAMDEIGHVPSPERSASPCTVATSARGASVAPPRDEVRRVKSESPDPPKPEKQKSRKRKSSSLRIFLVYL